MKPLLSALFALLLAGCGSVVQHGGAVGASLRVERLVLPPFVNATDDEHAGRALAEITGSALAEAGIAVFQTEEALSRTANDRALGPEGRYGEVARSVHASHLLIGTVHEYRYKTDLNGDPAVGVTLRVVEAATGQTVWQATSANVGPGFASLTAAGRKAVRALVEQMPVTGNRLRRDAGTPARR